MAHLIGYLLFEHLTYILTAVCLALANFLPSEGNPLTQPDQDRIKGLSGQLPEAPSASATPAGPQTSQDRNAEPSGSLPATPRRYCHNP